MVSRVQSQSLEAVRAGMNDPANWVSLLGSFRYEKALSDYIAIYPNRLEDGLLPHPNSKIRERVFRDRTRLAGVSHDGAVETGYPLQDE